LGGCKTQDVKGERKAKRTVFTSCRRNPPLQERRFLSAGEASGQAGVAQVEKYVLKNTYLQAAKGEARDILRGSNIFIFRLITVEQW